MRTRKSWQEKLEDSKGFPQVQKITGKMSSRWGKGTVLIPAPLEVDALMKRVPAGKLLTIDKIRAALAKKHKATIGCPITTGIFAWVAAHAAEEAKANGQPNITPYWRTLKVGGEINGKYPGGATALRVRLEAEGHKVVQRGKRFFVENFEKALVSL